MASWRSCRLPSATVGRQVRGEVEKLKEGDRALAQVSTFIIGDIGTALRAGQTKAQELGFDALILTDSDSGEAGTAANKYAAFLEDLLCSRKATGVPLCFLAGGELTVTVKGKGLGGRNTEFVLALLACPVVRAGSSSALGRTAGILRCNRHWAGRRLETARTG
jgi:glycerate-2-kinase